MRVKMTNFASFWANETKYGREGGGDTNAINHLIKQVSAVCGNFKILAFHPLSNFYDFHNKKQTVLKVYLMETRCCLWSKKLDI